MELHPDFSELLRIFCEEQVRFLIVGGYALAVHDLPRFTKDLDIWIEATPSNAERTHRALARFGAPVSDLSVADLYNPEVVFQVGVAPVRADIIVSITGVTFEQAWQNRILARYGEVEIAVIGKGDLITNKRAVGRPQDLLDALKLESRMSP